MSYIEGYAYTKTQGGEAKRRFERYKEIQHLRAQMNLEPNPSYAVTHYRGVIPDGASLSDLDILLLCDSGNTCFGGTVDRCGNEFCASVYTD